VTKWESNGVQRSSRGLESYLVGQRKSEDGSVVIVPKSAKDSTSTIDYKKEGFWCVAVIFFAKTLPRKSL